MHVANDGDEIAVTDPNLAAARVSAKPALGVVEIRTACLRTRSA